MMEQSAITGKATTQSSPAVQKGRIPLWLGIVSGILICMSLGAISSIIMQGDLRNWYAKLAKSSLEPKSEITGMIWGAVQLLLGISLGIIIHNYNHPNFKQAITVFTLHLIANFLAGNLFFLLRSPVFGLSIFIADILIIYTIHESHKISNVAAFLQLPYIFWLGLTTYFNCYIFWFN